MTSPAVAALLADLRVGHSEFQLDYFVVAANGVTPWGAYQQCLRELRTREESLRSGEFELRRLILRIARAQTRVDELRGLDRQDALLEADMATEAHVALTGLQLDRTRERDHLLARATALRAEIGVLTPQRIQRLDAEHWYAVVRRRCAFELMANARVEPQTLGLLASLRPDLRARVCAVIDPSMRGALFEEALQAEVPAALLAPAEAAPC